MLAQWDNAGNLLLAGIVYQNGSNATPTQYLSLTGDGRNSNGSVIAAAASSGDFGVSVTLGTSFFLISEAANSSTKTDIALFEFALKTSYSSANTLSLIVNANYTIGSGTVSVATIQPKLYAITNAGVSGAELSGAVATAFTGTAGDITFTVPKNVLTGGNRYVLTVTMVLTETAGSNVTGNINSIRMQ